MKLIFRGKTIALTTAVFVLLVFLHSIKILDAPEKFFIDAVAPIQKKLYNAGRTAGLFIQNIFSEKNANEADLLRAEVRSLTLQNAQLKLLTEENNLLKKELGFSRQYNYELIAARVIGYDSLENSDLLIMRIENKKYKNSDIAVDMPIVAADGVLIGKIAEIKEGEFFMRPVTSPQNAVAATVLNKNYTLGVIEGEFNFGIKMTMIPQSEKLKQGDLVTSSGLEPKMPKGLLIGAISKIENDPQNPFNIAHITPFYDAKNLSDVLIIKNY